MHVHLFLISQEKWTEQIISTCSWCKAMAYTSYYVYWDVPFCDHYMRCHILCMTMTTVTSRVVKSQSPEISVVNHQDDKIVGLQMILLCILNISCRCLHIHIHGQIHAWGIGCRIGRQYWNKTTSTWPCESISEDQAWGPIVLHS